MRGTAFVHASGETFLRFAQIGVAMAVLERTGQLVGATPSAQHLLRRFQLPCEPPAVLPPQLARELTSTPRGEAIVWRHPDADLGAVLGCTRYSLGVDHDLLLMREITQQQRALSQRLHRQRLEATGRLVSHIAHDLRAPLSSIVYNADLLAKRADLTCGEQLHHIKIAADALRDTIAGLLDYVRLGPPVVTTLPLRRLLDRVSSLLHPAFRAGKHRLTITLDDQRKVSVRGNPIAIEQIFVNLLVNSIESRSDRGVHVEIASRVQEDTVVVRVTDDGPGMPPELREAAFQAFVTSKPNGTGLGLTMAREAALALGGSLALEDSTGGGCCFAVTLPIVEDGP